ncbi:hypothetical protein SKAU_G00275420 [Synaphobranchus kaupii]|uniref:Gypsy retrotransposon integrase-like protein 1 n=1 Tax=Synaphobranchus kaupii TaxID=118154 RepID=A0A9Q1F168_SYNKA|nr:hypothetical protein SKAU_G00275420 [Synaphobranchus kaupii]
MGPKTFNLLRCLVQPDRPGTKSYAAIVTTLTAHFSPKPLVIAERFRFHKRNQEEGESVTVFVAALRRKCGKKGHLERACKSKGVERKPRHGTRNPKQRFKKSVHSVQPSHTVEAGSSSSEEATVYVLSVQGGPDGYWITPLLNGKPVRMEIDTGAAVSLVSYAVYKKTLKHLPLQPTSLILRTYTGESVPTEGVVNVTVKVNNQTAKLPLYVVKGNFPSLLGRSWLEEISLDWPAIRKICKGESHLSVVLEKHAEVFNDELGTMKEITIKLNLKPDSRPKFFKARTVPYAIKPKVEAELEALVKSGVLEPVRQSDWGTPIVPVPKKDGSVRICGDFKVTINPVLEAEQYPLPHINDLFAGLAGGQKFSKIDLNQAYLQMQVDEKSKKLLTVVTHKGHFRYCRLPFGITSAPAVFQRAMDQILSGLNGVQCYLDDILVTGKTEEEHLENLEATLQRLKEYGLRVRRSKCEFFQSSVEYLGHVIDSEGLHKAPSKIKALTDAPAPENVSQLRSFLGLLNYYGKFIENLSSLLKPLHELLCDGKAWEWTERCEAAFEQAKRALLESDALTHFDPALPLQLACDASPYGVGAVVSHIMPNGILSLAASRMQRWALLLSAHDYDIKYRKSDLHANADGLSRLPLPVNHSEPFHASRPPQAGIFYFRQVEEAPITHTQVKRHTRNDPVLSKLLDIVIHGGCGDIPELKHYLARKNELSVQAVIIPPGLRKKLLQQLHAGHSGMVRMKELARSYFWWPGLDGPIEETARTCPSCQQSVELQVVLATPGQQLFNLPPVGGLVSLGDETNKGGVVRKLQELDRLVAGVKTTEDIIWRRHTDQLLLGSTASSVQPPPVVSAEPVEQDRPAQPTITQDVPCAVEPVSPGSISSDESHPELSPSTPAPAGVNSPGGSAIRRYPQRERRLPKRLDL